MRGAEVLPEALAVDDGKLLLQSVVINRIALVMKHRRSEREVVSFGPKSRLVFRFCPYPGVSHRCLATIRRLFSGSLPP